MHLYTQTAQFYRFLKRQNIWNGKCLNKSDVDRTLFRPLRIANEEASGNLSADRKMNESLKNKSAGLIINRTALQAKDKLASPD
jgi:hypothetical protein